METLKGKNHVQVVVKFELTFIEIMNDLLSLAEIFFTLIWFCNWTSTEKN
jgi:hypothetical protein